MLCFIYTWTAGDSYYHLWVVADIRIYVQQSGRHIDYSTRNSRSVIEWINPSSASSTICAATLVSREVIHALHSGDNLIQWLAFVSLGEALPGRVGIIGIRTFGQRTVGQRTVDQGRLVKGQLIKGTVDQGDGWSTDISSSGRFVNGLFIKRTVRQGDMLLTFDRRPKSV